MHRLEDQARLGTAEQAASWDDVCPSMPQVEEGAAGRLASRHTGPDRSAVAESMASSSAGSKQVL